MKLNLIYLKLLCCLAIIFFLQSHSFAAKPGYYYQIKIYHVKGEAQERTVDSYLKNAYLPALHRFGVQNIGVFKPVKKDSLEQLIYVFIPFKKIDNYLNLDQALTKDQAYLAAGKSYLDASFDNSPFLRIESILLKAFDAMPSPAMPNLSSLKAERIYELRSYEASTEKLSLNKIGMFNDAEISIFTKLNFNAVFYGQVISGSKMPNLMYLTTFNNKEDREKHWSAFGPEYKKISGLPQYQNNVSKNVTLFLYPTDYSDF
ncbi:NIPSNAP family containing protein [Pedobacter frigidisoli]|uniref:NIPSNAP family containing protein n=1 Tax=Pedobacter frigidisoli TaxID=2530455 RepID=A0A4R0NZL5_9SPHI|nr:NIPSNAP family protein [Pedobacter frigidisoli]TCD08355.1 NIPSNAP family containing protein [Pedobacter frigidisoli]